MLHVLLLILKITGIVIACILGLVIIVVAAVLFVPVRYKADADYHGKFKAHAKLSWLGPKTKMIRNTPIAKPPIKLWQTPLMRRAANSSFIN